MTSLVKISADKYCLYDVKSVYYRHSFDNSGVYIRGKNRDESRNVNIDWQKYGETIKLAGEDSKISLDDIKANSEKKIESTIRTIKVSKALTDTEFWNIINSVVYCDKDDRLISIHNISSVISRKTCKKILSKIDNQFIPELTILLANNTPASNNTDIVFRLIVYKNFLTHIIFKGFDFYNGVRETPMLSQYIYEQNQFYDIHDWLEKLVR